MKLRMSGRRAFVTGASRGIGRAIAQALSAEGAWVIGTRTGHTDVDREICREWVQADFADVAQIHACAARVRECQPDVLINNVGINKLASFAHIDPNDFLMIQQVNVFAPFLLCQAAIPGMKAKSWGRIVNVSSIWGKISKVHRAAYSASKFAIDGMTLALAAEYSSDGIIANSIAPGFIDTELTRHILGEEGINALVPTIPAGRLGRVEEIARLVLWLVSDENTYLAGQNIAIDGAFSRV
jgi:NAD(P)-dependent dehydrogenase (short-subunit alcohol dehydrogenase family)